MNQSGQSLAPANTRLGQLQRGRGAGYCAALAAGPAALDEVMDCVRLDRRPDAWLEDRDRYFAELFWHLDASVAGLLAELRDVPELLLAHGVLAGLWRLGQVEVRGFLATATEGPLFANLVAALHANAWALPRELPSAAAQRWLRLEVDRCDSIEAVPQRLVPSLLQQMSVDELLEAGRTRVLVRSRLVGELCARGDEATRAFLAQVATSEFVYSRVQLAAIALGTLGDERLLGPAEELFAREDVFADPRRRLNGMDRMRRTCLADHLLYLPAQRGLELARGYLNRGGFFTTVAGTLFAEHATAADRPWLEQRVAESLRAGEEQEVFLELDALGRLADPESAPLLLSLARESASSLIRIRAVNALASMPEVEGVSEVLREALWDSEEESVATACYSAKLDEVARSRVEELANSLLVTKELSKVAKHRLASLDGS